MRSHAWISSIRSLLAVGVNESYALGTVQNLDSGPVQSPVQSPDSSSYS